MTYLPSHLEETDTATLHALVRTHPLGTWVVPHQGELLVNNILFLLDTELGKNGTLVGPVARANPVWQCWRRHRFDPGCRFPLTHPIGRDTRSVQRFQPLYPGAVKVGSLGQMVVGTHTWSLIVFAKDVCTGFRSAQPTMPSLQEFASFLFLKLNNTLD